MPASCGQDARAPQIENVTFQGIAVILLALVSLSSHAKSPKVAIATAHPLATAAGFDIIKQGGNVFDAAVAISAALAVVEPTGSGLGGGGYWLLHNAQDHSDHLIDARETAPAAAHKDLFLDSNGKLIPKLSLDGPLAAAIPGLPAALVHLSEKYGRLPLAQSLAPAIGYARFGFAIGNKHLKLLNFRAAVLKKYPQSAAIFLADDGKAPAAFSILKQTDLADTLSRLASAGFAGFYAGETADKLVSSVTAAGGIWTKQDLANYHIVERQPLKGHYKGVQITTAAPSSSGGIVLLETLNMLSAFDLQHATPVTRVHLITEALRRAYHDRALYLGDSDFIDVPVARLTNLDYAAGLLSSLRPDKALPSNALSGDLPAPSEGTNTTHFSIIDDQGNRVAATLSINFPFGSGFVATGTGVLLNDEMDDFASQSGVGNGYGLIGGAANAIAANKRPLSSMTPTFLDDGKRIAVLGTPGGSRIPSMVILASLAFAEGENPGTWVQTPRFHHQFLPDVLEFEADALSPNQQQQLQALGHQLKPARYAYGDMQAVQLQTSDKTLTAVSDHRGEGQALVGD